MRSSPPGLNKVARSQPRWTQHGNTWTAARARISSFVMKAAAAADFAEVVAAAHAAIKAQADDCRRLSIGVVSSGIACATWMAYGHKLRVVAYSYRTWGQLLYLHVRYLLHVVTFAQCGMARGVARGLCAKTVSSRRYWSFGHRNAAVASRWHPRGGEGSPFRP